jgi:hypothetical protein
MSSPSGSAPRSPQLPVRTGVPTLSQAKTPLFRRRAVEAIAAETVELDESMSMEDARKEAGETWDEALKDSHPEQAIASLWEYVERADRTRTQAVNIPPPTPTDTGKKKRASPDEDDVDQEETRPTPKMAKGGVSRELADNFMQQMKTGAAQELIKGKHPFICKWVTSLIKLCPDVAEAKEVTEALAAEFTEFESGARATFPDRAAEAVRFSAEALGRISEGIDLMFTLIFLLAFAGPESGTELCSLWEQEEQVQLLGINLSEENKRRIAELKRTVAANRKLRQQEPKGKGGGGGGGSSNHHPKWKAGAKGGRKTANPYKKKGGKPEKAAEE